MISADHTAIGTGLASTTRQLVSTACISGMRRSSSRGIETTLEAKIGAARMPPIDNQASNRKWLRPSTTWRRKSIGVWMGAGAIRVISAAEVSTQPVPAMASRTPKRTRHQ
jgi:hypothetical protein